MNTRKYLKLLAMLPAILLATALLSCGGVLPTVVKFDTRPQAPWVGDTVLLEWVVKGADHVLIDGVNVADSGNKWIVIDSSRDYILVAHAPRAEYTKKLHIIAEHK
ncbi:MAG: hypothetical protein WCH46_01525 [bacterium]